MYRYPFPKIELHLHLDGSIPPKLMWELMEKEGVETPVGSYAEFDGWLKETSDCRDVNEYLKRFELPLRILQNKENLALVTEGLIDSLAEQNYRCAEIRFAPQLHMREGLSQRDAVDAVLEGRQRALERNPELGIGIILCAMSIGPETLNMEQNLETVRVTEEYLGKGVCALDLAGAEGIVPLRNFSPVFALARELKVPFTCHAGDSQGADTVLDALSFGTKRIGHGHHIFNDPELTRRAAAQGVTLEICPSSNIQCSTQPSYAGHPAKKLFDLGMRVTISTDNMTLAAVTLDDEYDRCLNEMGFEYNDLVKMNIYAAEALFAPEETKRAIITELEGYYK